MPAKRAKLSLLLAVYCFVALVILLYAHFARADGINPKIDCDLVRIKVAEHGKIVVYTWALSNGYSQKEIARIRKVCGL